MYTPLVSNRSLICKFKKSGYKTQDREQRCKQTQWENGATGQRKYMVRYSLAGWRN